MWKPLWLRRFLSWFASTRRLHVMDGDTLPPVLPARALVLVRDDGEDWSVGMRCPCGCGDALEMMVLAEAEPRWTLTTDHKGLPTLHPSIWRRTDCKAHFWLRHGRVIWCE